MRGPVLGPHVLVVLAAGILSADDYLDGRAQRAALEDPGQDLGAVGLSPLAGDVALPGPATIELPLDLIEP